MVANMTDHLAITWLRPTRSLPVFLTSMMLAALLLLQLPCSYSAQVIKMDPKDCAALFSWKPLRTTFSTTLAAACPGNWCSGYGWIACLDTGRVEKVFLGNSQLTGTLPAEWSALTNLTHLYLSANNLTGTLPAKWSALTSLTYLELMENKLTGTLPAEWSSLTSLKGMSLFGNNLTGNLPAKWSTLGSLTDLTLDNNRLIGTLPAEWSDLILLSALSLDNTRLTGTLPADWSTLQTLTQLSLSNTRLSGTLPADWSSLRSMTDLSLSNTRLTGTLPADWSTLTRLSKLLLDNTRLTGTVPTEWGDLKRLSNMDVSGTDICGSAPMNFNLQLRPCTAVSSPKRPQSPKGPLPVPSPNPPNPGPSASASPSLPKPPPPPPPPPKAVIIGAAVGASVLVAAVVGVVVVVRRHGCAGLKPPVAMLPADQKHSDDGTNQVKDVEAAGGSGGSGGPVSGARRSWLSGMLGVGRNKPRQHTGASGNVSKDVGVGSGGAKHSSVVNPMHVGASLEPSAPVVMSDWRPSPQVGISSSPPLPLPSGDSTYNSEDAQAAAAEGPSVMHDVMATSSSSHASSRLPHANTAPVQGGTTASSFTHPQPAPIRSLPEPKPTAAATKPIPETCSSSPKTFHLGGPAAPGLGGAGPAPAQLALASGLFHAGGDGLKDIGVATALGVSFMLPKCIQLGTSIIAAGERVVANNARCSHLVSRVSALQPLLQKLANDNGRLGEAADEDAEGLGQVLANIHKVFGDVHGCISTWCSASRKGSVVTVIRNMVTSSWYQEGFLELNMRLSGAFTDLSTAMHIQDWSARQAVDRSKLLEESLQQTEEDLQGLVQELVAVDESGQDQWSALEPEDRQRVSEIFSHHRVDLNSSLKKARAEALDQRVKGFLIPPGDIVKDRLLGQGGYGEVHEGMWRGHIPVALKTLMVGVMTERDTMDIMREAYIHHAAHNHPNVCQLYGLVLKKPTDCVLVMELYPSNLQQLLRDDDVVLSMREQCLLALGAASGMAHLHAKNIVHGDLKPSNLLVDNQKNVAVSDFGLSSISCVTLTASTLSAKNKLSSASTGLSIWYSPPELLDNISTKKTTAGDVYAFAIVMFEIFTRGLPYSMGAYDVVLRLVLAGQRPRLPDTLPADLSALIRSCWDQDPAARPQFAAIVEKLKAILAQLK